MSLANIHVRPFLDAADEEAMLDLARAGASEGARHTYYQMGDVLWQLHQWLPEVLRAEERIFLCEDATGKLMAFLWFGREDLWMQLHPQVRQESQSEAIVATILDWSEAHIRQAHPDSNTFEVACLEDDALLGEALAARGFARGKPVELIFDQPLDHPLTSVALPAGWSIRHITAEKDFVQRVELHRTVWQPSRVTVESYQQLRQVPLYRPELDIVAVAPDGTFASYCICWFDAVNRTGEFEPVGTHPAFRQQGLSKAILREGCRRLQALGATLATVCTGAEDALPKFNATAARALYESAGFTVVNHRYSYRKSLV